jgi:hypothetical protein
MMVTYHLHYNNYLEVTRSYKAMYEDEEVAADPARWMPVRGGWRGRGRVWYATCWGLQGRGFAGRV